MRVLPGVDDSGRLLFHDPSFEFVLDRSSIGINKSRERKEPASKLSGAMTTHVEGSLPIRISIDQTLPLYPGPGHS